jgi:hypothetical protein
MKRKIIALPHFDRRLKRLVKKFRTLSSEMAAFETSIEQYPKQGKDLGAGLYKIRLASKSKGTGKSGGFRVVTYYIEQVGDDEIIYLVTIYDKSEEDSVTKADLLAIVEEALNEDPSAESE